MEKKLLIKLKLSKLESKGLIYYLLEKSNIIT